MADGPPGQSSIDALNTATPNMSALADIAQTHICMADGPPGQSSIHALNTATPK